MSARLRIGITLGCPSGIGPEVTARAVASATHGHQLVIFGAPSAWEDAQRFCGVEIPTTPATLDHLPDDAVVLVPSVSASVRFTPGAPDATSDAATAQALKDALSAARSNLVDAVVTAPLRKQSLALMEGGPFPGHTELFHNALGTSPVPVMLFVTRGMRLALHTIHVPLREVPSLLTDARLQDTLRTLHHGLENDLGLQHPRIDVLALNPHASEGGLIGDEDPRILGPALERARTAGINAQGPFPADGYFARYRDRAAPSAVLALYHDQGLAPFKLWEHGRGCQMTLGLRVPRTSPDHGTAYDLAGKGDADARSMQAALDLAVRVAKVRRRTRRI